MQPEIIFDSVLLPIASSLQLLLNLVFGQLVGGVGQYRVERYALPKTDEQLDTLLIMSDHAEYGYVDDSGVYFLFTPNSTGWLDVLGHFGFSFWNTKKLIKRARILTRPATLMGFRADLRVLELSWDRFIRNERTRQTYLDALAKDSDALLKPLDGGIVVRESIKDSLWEEALVRHPELLDSRMGAKISRTPLLNGRATGPQGQIKGQFFCMDDDEFDAMYGEDYDICVLEGEIKDDLTLDGGWHILLDPQEGHWAEHLNVQLFINMLGVLWDVPTLLSWTNDMIERAKDKLRNNDVLEGPAELLRREEALRRKGKKDEGAHLVQQWVAAELHASLDGTDKTWRVTNVPGLVMGIARAFGRSIYREDDLKQRVRVRIPGAGHFQVVTESFARACGVTIGVKDGEIRFSKRLQAFVVTDVDFLTNYRNHGGPDLDDFYTLIFRIWKGEKYVIVVRSPNAYGEYARYRYHTGDEVPTDMVDGGWLTLHDDIVWPIQLAEAVDTGLTQYQGLPSSQGESTKPARRTYVLADFKDAIMRAFGGMTGSAGAFVNVHLWYTLTFREHMPIQVCSMEDGIDTFTQGGDDRDRQAIQEWCEAMVNDGVTRLNAEDRATDRLFWTKRGLKRMLYEGADKPKLADGPFTRLVNGAKTIIHDFCSSAHLPDSCKVCQASDKVANHNEYFWSWSVEFAQGNAKLPPNMEKLVTDTGALGDWGGTKSGAWSPSTGGRHILRNFREQWGKVIEFERHKREDEIAELEELLAVDEMIDPDSIEVWKMERQIEELRNTALSVDQHNIGMLIRQTQFPFVGRTAAQIIADTSGANYITDGLYARKTSGRGGYDRLLARHESYLQVIAAFVAAYKHKNGKGLIDESVVTSGGLEAVLDQDGNALPNITVTNSGLWMEALRHYGFVAELDGSLHDEWDLECNTCDTVVRTNNPVHLALAETHGMTCKDCRHSLTEGGTVYIVCAHCGFTAEGDLRTYERAKANGFLCKTCRDPEKLAELS